MKFNSPNVNVSADYLLNKRNESGLGTEKGKIGDIWKSNKTGQIYRDKFFFVEKDFGWITGIGNASRIKSIVSGVGMKIVENNGDPIVAGESGIAWKDLRKYPSWTESAQESLQKEKKIRVQRVPYYEIEDKNGVKQTFDLSEGTCVINIGNPSTVGVYLIIDFAETGENSESGGKRLDWDKGRENFLVKEFGCEKLKGWMGSGLKFRLDNSWIQGGNHVAGNKSLIVLGNDNGIIQFGKNGSYPVIGVVLGVAINKAQYVAKNDSGNKDNWGKILSDDKKNWSGDNWTESEGVGDCLKGGSDSKVTGIEGKCLGGADRVNSFKKWAANVSLTYSYKLK